jgi:hypothetical protein
MTTIMSILCEKLLSLRFHSMVTTFEPISGGWGIITSSILFYRDFSLVGWKIATHFQFAQSQLRLQR